MDGLGLDTGQSSTAGPSKSPILDDLPESEDDNEYPSDDEDGTSDDEGQIKPHLDPFEREWAEKWLGGVIRRAQGWLEANQPDEDGEGHTSGAGVVAGTKEVEAVLRDATAVLAMMAGTSGTFDTQEVNGLADL